MILNIKKTSISNSNFSYSINNCKYFYCHINLLNIVNKSLFAEISEHTFSSVGRKACPVLHEAAKSNKFIKY